jgi:hypothetical protein
MTRPGRAAGLVLAALLISAGLYGLWWERAANASRAQLERWIEARRQAGFEISHQGITTAGFPLKLELAVANPRLDWAGAHPFSWQGPEKLMAHITAQAPGLLRMQAEGAHVIEAGGKKISLTLAKADGSLDMAMQGFAALHLALEGVEVNGAYAQPLRLPRLTLDAARRFDVAADDLQTPSASLTLFAEQISLPPDLKVSLGESIAQLNMTLALFGPVPENLKADSLKAWSEAGGILDLKSLHLEWGPLLLDGDGTLALDRALMPIAPFGLKVRGAAETLDALAERGLIEPANYMVVKLALAVLAKEPPDSETGSMRLPLTLQGQDLFVGPARLARLPAPPWVEE